MVRVLSSKTHRIPENGCVAISAAPHCLVLEIVRIKRCVFWPDKDRFAGSMKHLIDKGACTHLPESAFHDVATNQPGGWVQSQKPILGQKHSNRRILGVFAS